MIGPRNGNIMGVWLVTYLYCYLNNSDRAADMHDFRWDNNVTLCYG